MVGLVDGDGVLMEMWANGASGVDGHGEWERSELGVGGCGSDAFSEIDSYDRLLVSCVMRQHVQVRVENWGRFRWWRG